MLTCSCCGKLIDDSLEDNVNHGVIPNPDDEGFGMCRACGGDSTAQTTRKKMGWALACFVDARVPIVRGALSLVNQKRFDKMTYEKKVVVVTRMVEKGLIT